MRIKYQSHPVSKNNNNRQGGYNFGSLSEVNIASKTSVYAV